jgi:prevent-host-death family protein
LGCHSAGAGVFKSSLIIADMFRNIFRKNAVEMDMPQVSSGDVQKNFGEYRMVAEEEPVHVSHYNKPSVVIVSAEEYARLKKRDKQAMATEDLPEWLVEQIAHSEMDAKYNYLDEDA